MLIEITFLDRSGVGAVKKAERDPVAGAQSSGPWTLGAVWCGSSRWASVWFRSCVSAVRPRNHAPRGHTAHCEVHGDGSLIHNPLINRMFLAGVHAD